MAAGNGDPKAVSAKEAILRELVDILPTGTDWSRLYALLEGERISPDEAHELARLLAPALRPSNEGGPEEAAASEANIVIALTDIQRADRGQPANDDLDSIGVVGEADVNDVAAAGLLDILDILDILDPRSALRLWPLNDNIVLKSQLGAPVDAQYAVLGTRHLDGWQHSGAIWYSHACCSAGSDAVSRHKGLLPEDGAIGSLLNQIAAAAGATIAPLPRSLLGAEKPLRAFIGYVEPTFDWTLRDPANKQVLTHVLCAALYDKLYKRYERNPIGLGLAEGVPGSW